jgi:hypothetical protein
VPGPLKQRHAEFVFQGPDLPGHGRLHDAEQLGGLGKAANFYHRYQRLELLDLQIHASVVSRRCMVISPIGILPELLLTVMMGDERKTLIAADREERDGRGDR